MKIYSDGEERILKHLGCRLDDPDAPMWKTLFSLIVASYTLWFVKRDHIYERGMDVEALTYALTGDREEAWNTAEPYYQYARIKGHPDAAYRYVQYAEAFSGADEFLYASYLERAVRCGHKQAIHDYVYRYDEFKVKTISRDAWKTQQRQEKLYFRCCKALAEAGDPDALWRLGTCYLSGTGVKEDDAKGLILRDRAMAQWELDEEQREKLTAIQDLFKEEATKEKFSPARHFWKSLRELFTVRGQQKNTPQR